MRLLFGLVLAAQPALAWEFMPNPICTVSHETSEVTFKMTFDHASRLYALDLTTPDPWPSHPVFSIRFEGPRGLTISTTRQTYSKDRRTLTATDTGFGNVLNGLEFNRVATPMIGPLAIDIPLDGAAPEIASFRKCTEIPVS